MADATRLFAPLARERSRILETLSLQPGGYAVATVHREANVTQPERLRRIVDGLQRVERPRRLSCTPPHTSGDRGAGSRAAADRPARLPRLRGTRLAGASRAHRLRGIAEGGVLVQGALRDNATEHGMGRHGRGRRECPRRRRSRTLIADGRGRRPLPGRRAGALRRRPRLRARRGRAVRLTAVAEPFTYDVAVIGAGYVGLPLSVTFAEAGSKVLIVDVQTRLDRRHQQRRQPHRGRLVRPPQGADRPGPDHRDGRLRRGT